MESSVTSLSCVPLTVNVCAVSQFELVNTRLEPTKGPVAVTMPTVLKVTNIVTSADGACVSTTGSSTEPPSSTVSVRLTAILAVSLSITVTVTVTLPRPL